MVRKLRMFEVGGEILPWMLCAAGRVAAAAQQAASSSSFLNPLGTTVRTSSLKEPEQGLVHYFDTGSPRNWFTHHDGVLRFLPDSLKATVQDEIVSTLKAEFAWLRGLGEQGTPQDIATHAQAYVQRITGLFEGRLTTIETGVARYVGLFDPAVYPERAPGRLRSFQGPLVMDLDDEFLALPGHSKDTPELQIDAGFLCTDGVDTFLEGLLQRFMADKAERWNALSISEVKRSAPSIHQMESDVSSLG